MSIYPSITCVHQPPFLPWLGIVESMFVCETFIVYDDVQFEDGGYQNRNRIKTSSGAEWITVPVRKRFGQLISEVEIADTYSPAKIRRSLELNYSRAPYYRDLSSEIGDVLVPNGRKLVDLNMQLLNYVKDKLQAGCEFRRSSEITISYTDRAERLLNLCRAVDAAWLYSGSGTRAYADEANYERNGVRIIWHDYQDRHMNYPQLYPRLGFIPCLSFVDPLFNIGPLELSSVLKQSGLETVNAQMTHA